MAGSSKLACTAYTFYGIEPNSRLTLSEVPDRDRVAISISRGGEVLEVSLTEEQWTELKHGWHVSLEVNKREPLVEAVEEAQKEIAQQQQQQLEALAK